MILKILESFIRNEIPGEVFNQAVSAKLFPDKIPMILTSKNAFSLFLYEYAMRIRTQPSDFKN